jgi:hypothetical protein
MLKAMHSRARSSRGPSAGHFPRAALAILLTAALAAPRPGAAQKVAVPQAPWQAGESAVTAGLVGLGYPLRPDTASQRGLRVLHFGAGTTELAAVFGSQGLAMLNEIYDLPEVEARQRLGVLRDSLERQLGPPDSVGEEVTWKRRDGDVRLYYRRAAGALPSSAVFSRASPTYLPELRASYRAAVGPEGMNRAAWLRSRADFSHYLPLFVSDTAAITFDSSSVEKQGEGHWRVTVRWDWLTPQPTGGIRFDTMMQPTEVRCDRNLYRVRAITLLLGTRVVLRRGNQWTAWRNPPPTSALAVIVREICGHMAEHP